MSTIVPKNSAVNSWVFVKFMGGAGKEFPVVVTRPRGGKPLVIKKPLRTRAHSARFPRVILLL
jgi:hypothetical protein